MFILFFGRVWQGIGQMLGGRVEAGRVAGPPAGAGVAAAGRVDDLAAAGIAAMAAALAPPLQHLVQDRDRLIADAPQLFQEFFRTMPGQPNFNVDRLNALNQRYSQMIERISDANRAIAVAGGGNQAAIARRFAELQTRSISTLEQRLRMAIGNQIENANFGLMTDMLVPHF